ncbi:MAG TPA: hypothetical protein VK487_04850 [Candidatus Bathyarchaeia archaeon]|nr:hypothetical protein [Candidatus Bathyarchaeia archaeon]
MRSKAWTTMRGRPPGRLYSSDDMRLLEYLTSISVKHEIDSGKFFSSLLDAFQHEEANCGKLSIECRMKTQNHAIFLITTAQKVIAQFPIPTHILAKTNLLEEFSHKPSFMRNSNQEHARKTLDLSQISLNSKP